MDIAYDHLSSPIHEAGSSPSNPSTTNTSDPSEPTSSNSGPPLAGAGLNQEFQQAFQAVSASPWGAKLGGWFSSARKQGETLIQEAEKEASKGWSSFSEQIATRTRGMSTGEGISGPVPGEEEIPVSAAEKEKLGGENGKGKGKETESGAERSEDLTADIMKEASSVFANLRVAAASRLKGLQEAEDKADEALEKFGLGVRDFLRNAVVVTAPSTEGEREGEVLFETQEAGTGKKVFHTTRLDAQLHAIHTTPSSFVEEPKGGEWEGWTSTFDIDAQTGAIAADLEKFPELRTAMEKLVPEKVEYKDFWQRYYWLRKAVEEDEKRRKEVLKGATTAPDEEVTWDSDDEEADTTPQNSSTPANNDTTAHKASQSTTTLNAPTTTTTTLGAPRKSEDESRSVADSEASYDIVSGATSRATGSPKAKEKDAGKEESDDDWE